MAARRWPADGDSHDEAALLARLAAAGWRRGYGWGNGPGERYAEHSHDYEKALYCVTGSLVFRIVDGDLPLGPGDRLELDRGTAHSAIVGPNGVRCVEAHRF